MIKAAKQPWQYCSRVCHSVHLRCMRKQGMLVFVCSETCWAYRCRCSFKCPLQELRAPNSCKLQGANCRRTDRSQTATVPALCVSATHYSLVVRVDQQMRHVQTKFRTASHAESTKPAQLISSKIWEVGRLQHILLRALTDDPA